MSFFRSQRSRASSKASKGTETVPPSPTSDHPGSKETPNAPLTPVVPTPTTNSNGEGSYGNIDAYGNEANAEIQYQTCHWFEVGLLMLAETISLGVLALPNAVAVLGLAPGILLIAFLGIMAGYTGYLIGQFKIAFPHVCSFADVGEMVAGRLGKEIMAYTANLLFVGIMAAHILTFTKAMTVLTEHRMCMIVFSVIGLAISFVLGLPRKLQHISWISLLSSISVAAAVLTAMIDIAINKPKKDDKIFAVAPGLSAPEGMASVSTMVLAYAGHVAFFSFCGEMKKPQDFTKALAFMQISACGFYCVIAAIIYYYAGPHVESPALGSASPLVRKVCWGLAMPTIVVAGVVNGAVACKYVYLRLWEGTDVIHKRNFKAYASWYGICASLWTLSWLVSEVIPNFNVLLGLIASLFCSWYSYGIPSFLWLYQHYLQGRDVRADSNGYRHLVSSPKRIILTMINVGILLMAMLMCVFGLYSNGLDFASGKAGKPFAC